MANSKKENRNNNLELIKKIPEIKENSNNKQIIKRSNWFNKNLAIIIFILFILIGALIVFIIAR